MCGVKKISQIYRVKQNRVKQDSPKLIFANESIDTKSFQFIDETSPGDPQQPGGTGTIATGFCQRLADVFNFIFPERLDDRIGLGSIRKLFRWNASASFANDGRQVLRTNDIRLTKQPCMLDGIG